MSWPIVDPRLDRTLEEMLTVVFWTVWGAFCVDFLVRVVLADRRGHYILHHWYDVALIGLPVLRPLRLLRALAFARLLSRSAARNFVGRTTLYVVGAAIIAVLLGALAVLDAERSAADGNIKALGDAVWWACATVTTVGYGDHYPVTASGRVVAVALMLVGIALVGSVTAAVATWFIQHVQAEQAAISDDDLRSRGQDPDLT